MKDFFPLSVLLISLLLMGQTQPPQKEMSFKVQRIGFPPPSIEGRLSLESAIARRRSVRRFQPKPLDLKQVSQLLWSAQGITDTLRGLRAVPSAGACYPLDIYIAVGQVDGLEPGLYRYQPPTHSLETILRGDQRKKLRSSGRTQQMVEEAPAVFIITADLGRIRPRYGSRAERYTFMEAGHAGQNISLQAVALGLATVMVGAFDDEGILAALGKRSIVPLYLIPVGYPRE